MKRKKETESKDESKQVQKKQKAEEFTDIEFRVLIKDQSARFSVLEKFLNHAETYPKENKYDIVAAYCRSSGECAEIFHLMEEGRRKQTELALIFNVLERILTRIATDLTKYKIVAENIIKKLLSHHIKNVYFMLSKLHKSSQIKSALKLLTAMVMQGERAARDVFMQMDFNHSNVHPLLSRRDIKDPDDARTCLIYFYMAFLLHGDNSLVRQLVDTRGVLKSIFGGMVYDKPLVIEFVLETLLSKVIENSAINKTSKIRVFDESGLRCLVSLYHWKGPSKFVYGKKSAEKNVEDEEEPTEIDNEELQLVRSNIHKLLLELCCSFKNGINFYDKTLGTSGKNQNHVLTAFLSNIKKPYKNAQIKELVISILKTCPDQLRKYLTSLQEHFVPRVSPSWIACMNFLAEIYENQIDVPASIKSGDLPCHKLLQMAQVTIVPPGVILNFINQAVKKRTSRLIRHMALKFLLQVFEKVQAVIAYFKSQECKYPHKVKDEFVQLFQEVIQKVLPDLKSISSCWDFLRWEKSGEGAAEDMEVDDGEAELETGTEDLGMVDMQTTVIQTLASYRKTFPHTTQEHFINLSLFLDGVKKSSLEEQDQTKLSQLYLGVLSLLANSDNKMIPWNKVNDEGQSFVYLVLEMLFSTSYDQTLASATKNQVVKLLVSTGLFDWHEKEILIWLDHLISCEEDARPVTLKYLEKVLTTLLTTPQAYADQVTKVVQETQQSENALALESVMESSDEFVKVILSQEDVAIEKDELMAAESENNSSESVSLSTRAPFSALVPVSLKVLEKFKEEKSVINDYLKAVMMEILHCQVNIRPLHLMFEQRGSNFDDQDFKKYLESFITGLGRKMGTKSPEKGKIKRLTKMEDAAKILMTCWEKQPSYLLDKNVTDQIMKVISETSDHDAVSIIQQLLLYLHTVVSTAKKDPMLAEGLSDSFLGLIISIIKEKSSLLQSKEENNGNEEESCLTLSSSVETGALKTMFTLVLSHPTIMDNFLDLDFKSPIPLSLSLRLSKTVVTLVDHALTFETNSVLCVPYSEKIQKSIVHARTGLPLYLASLYCLNTLATRMEISRIVQAVDQLLCERKEDLIQNGHLSMTAENVLEIMKKILERRHSQSKLSSRKDFYPFSYASIRKLSQMLFDLPSKSKGSSSEDAMLAKSKVYEILSKLLKISPEYTAVFTNEEFAQILLDANCGDGSSAASILSVALLILQHHFCGKVCFQKCIDTKVRGLMKHKLLYAPIYVTYLELAGPGDSVYGKIIDDLYWEFGLNSLREGSSLEQDEVMSHLLCLLLQFKDVDELEDVTENICSSLRTSKSTPIGLIKLLYAISLCSLKRDASEKHSSKVAENLISCLSGILGGKFDQPEDRNIVMKFVKTFTTIVKKLSKDGEQLVSMLSKYWPKIVKAGLRNHYETREVLDLLAVLADLVSGVSDLDPSFSTFLEMIMSHSKFLSVVLDEVTNESNKASVLTLMHVIISKNPACCQQSNVSILLAAYGATLSETDTKILNMLHVHESSGIGMSAYRPYIWGPKSVEHLSVKKDLGPSLWKHATTEQVLELLDDKKLMQSALKFPLRRKLMPSQDYSEDSAAVSDCYDPCFLLPLFSYLLRPDSLVNCNTFIENNCFSYTLAALSSHDPHMRGAAYHVLSRFTEHLEGSKFLGKEHVIYMLDCVKNSMETPNTKLACITGVFLARAAQLLVRPVDHMYGMIQSFLLLKPALDLVNVPEFYKLFNSSAMEFKAERRWILSLMADGLRESADYKIFEKKFAFKLLLSFHDSPTSDNATQVLVLKLVQEACKIKKVAYELVKKHGILTWLNGVISHRLGEGNKVDLMVEILSCLWATIAGDRSDVGKPDRKCLPLVFLSEVLFTLLNLLSKLSISTQMETFLKYTSMLASLMKELALTEATHIASGYQTLKVKPSLSQLLKLVEISAICSRDSEMLSELRSIDSNFGSKSNKDTVALFPAEDVDATQVVIIKERLVQIVSSCPIDMRSGAENTLAVADVQENVVKSVSLIHDWMLKSLALVPSEEWASLLLMVLQWFVDIVKQDCPLVNKLKDHMLQEIKPGEMRATEYLVLLFNEIAAIQVGNPDILDISYRSSSRAPVAKNEATVLRLRSLLREVFQLLKRSSKFNSSQRLEGLTMLANHGCRGLVD